MEGVFSILSVDTNRNTDAEEAVKKTSGRCTQALQNGKTAENHAQIDRVTGGDLRRSEINNNEEQAGNGLSFIVLKR